MQSQSAVLVVALICGWNSMSAAIAATVSVAEVNQQTVTVTNMNERNGVVTGEILNRSPNEVRDVELLVRREWRWKKEFSPGDNDPGTAAYQRVDKVIPPGGSVAFSFPAIATPASRGDGEFKTEITVAGFSEIVRP